MTAIVVTSGGMDSTAAVYYAKKHYFDIECMSFNYGQRHVKEIECAKEIADQLGVRHTIVDLTGITSLISSSALTNAAIAVPEGHYEQESMKATVVPNRNSMMLNIAIARAVSIGAEAVVTGVHAGDHAVYPDCRPEFIRALNKLAFVANEGFINVDFRIDAPWIGLTKADIVQVGTNTYNVPWFFTWTCYKGGEVHCGRCSTCVERLEAFYIAGFVDPVVYEDTEYWKMVTNV
jgi:7-cyano-7-deazaguanine synthase